MTECEDSASRGALPPEDYTQQALRVGVPRQCFTCNRLVAYYGGMDGDVDKVFKALADPGRRLLLDRLRADNGQTLGQLCEHLDMSRQAVTKHLKRLEEAGLVATIWRGREKFHYLNPVPIHQIAERWIGKYERGRLRVLAELKKNL
jgi:DNA-binding transcriptional ArsR family regulator